MTMSFDIFSNYPLSWQPNKDKLKSPIHKSIVEQMKRDIDNGVLLPGTKLPPQRELSYFLDVHFTTITKAYKLSQQQGLTYGVVGKGTYISPNVNTSLTITTDRVTAIKELGFMASFESSNKFLKPIINRVANQKMLLRLLNNENPTGLYEHKLIANKHLANIGMHANSKNTIITSGGNNALTIALMGAFKVGDKIAVDQFTYANFIELARLRGVDLIPVSSDEDGMRDDLLASLCESENINGIYLMPDCNNPTTQSISTSRRHTLAKIIKREHLILIEDDYLNFFKQFNPQSPIKMSNLVPDQSIYICSTSKTIASGISIAFMRTANQLQPSIETAMFNVNAKTSSLDTDIITSALEDGTANQIIQYKLDHAKHANRIFNNIFATESTNNNKTNLFRCLPISNNFNGEQIEKICLNEQLRVFHSDRFLVGPNSHNSFLRISIGTIDDFNELETSLIKLKAVLIKHHLDSFT